MAIKPTDLRANLFKMLDRVLKTGRPLEIEKDGEILSIQKKVKPSRFSRIVKRKVIIGNAEDLVHMDWSKEWKPSL